MPDSSTEEISLSQLQHLLGFWNTARIQSVEIPETGAMNIIRILTTDCGPYVMRIYRHNDPSRITQEHRVVQWACEQGIPVVTPLRTTDGATWITYEGRFVTLLPYVNGTQVRRDQLQPDHIEATGCFLGELHKVLERCPADGVREVDIRMHRQDRIDHINRLEAIVRNIEEPVATDAYALQRLITRREWLETRSNDNADALYDLPFQVLHGDYQESNVFFEDGAISAVIDWDKVYTAPAAWEVVRTLHLMLRFQAEPCRLFLEAYRERRALSDDELDISAHCYGMMRAYSLWLFEEIYDKGNDRVRRFLKPGGFVPVMTDWAQMREQIGSA